MANEEHVKVLREGWEKWNEWRDSQATGFLFGHLNDSEHVIGRVGNTSLGHGVSELSGSCDAARSVEVGMYGTSVPCYNV